MYKASYKIENFEDNTTILRDEFSCIIFSNIGDCDVVINGLRLSSGSTIEFNEKPDTIINTDFALIFDNTIPNAVKKVYTVKTFYKLRKI